MTVKPTEAMIEAAAKKQYERHNLMRWEHAFPSERGRHLEDAKAVLTAALAAQDAEPVRVEWCVHEDGEQRLGWYPDGYGDRAGWEALAKGWPEKYQIVTRPLYASPQPEPVRVPDGWQLVPVEATVEMFAAFEGAYMRKRFDMMSPSPTEEPDAGGGPTGYGYRAMLAAAPQPAGKEGEKP